MNADLRLADLAMQQEGAFARRQAAAVGFTPTMVRNRLETGRWGQMHHNTFRLAGTPATWDQALFGSWLAGGDGAVVSHIAAAWRWGFERVARRLEITVPSHRAPHLLGVDVHRSRQLPSIDWVERGSLLVTSPTRTVIDLAAQLGPALAGQLLDHFLSRHLTTTAYLTRRLDSLGRRGRTGAVLLDQLIQERPTHSRPPKGEFGNLLLTVLRTLGPPWPIPEYEVRLPDGSRRFLDAAYPWIKLGLEADSYLWHSSRTDWSADHVRNAALVAAGWRILPVTWLDLTERPAWLHDLVRQARGELCVERAV